MTEKQLLLEHRILEEFLSNSKSFKNIDAVSTLLVLSKNKANELLNDLWLRGYIDQGHVGEFVLTDIGINALKERILVNESLTAVKETDITAKKILKRAIIAPLVIILFAVILCICFFLFGKAFFI